MRRTSTRLPVTRVSVSVTVVPILSASLDRIIFFDVCVAENVNLHGRKGRASCANWPKTAEISVKRCSKALPVAVSRRTHVKPRVRYRDPLL